MSSYAEQQTRAAQVASEGIQQLLDAGISFKRIAEVHAATAVKLVLEYADIDDAQDLLVSLHMMLDKHEEAQRHGHACP